MAKVFRTSICSDQSTFSSAASKADYFMKEYGKRPSVNVDAPAILINLHGARNQYTLSLDSSGKPLNQRGYRQKGHQATLNEVLAAGMIQLSGWEPDTPFMDPMCGSGTLAIEAAMYATAMPAQSLRSDFGFMNWKSFSALRWNQIKSEAQRKIQRKPVKIFASDNHPAAIKMIKSSAKALQLSRGFEIDEKDFLKRPAPETKGTLISNPPYGKRLGGNEIHDFYKRIGDHLKQNYEHWDAWLLSSNMKAFKALRLRPAEKIILYNGALECQFCQYKLYKGSDH
jgi:putative N6-adenine-specific DNA methylase